MLCAAGPCREGIGFPGDMVSLPVIVRPPFPEPNPLSEAEQKQYPDLVWSSVLIGQMEQLLTAAEQHGIQIVGTSQNISSGKTLNRTGLGLPRRGKGEADL